MSARNIIEAGWKARYGKLMPDRTPLRSMDDPLEKYTDLQAFALASQAKIFLRKAPSALATSGRRKKEREIWLKKANDTLARADSIQFQADIKAKRA